MGEGQYRVDDELRGQLNELDDRAVAALEADDEPTLDAVLDEMWELVRGRGERLPDEDLSAVGRRDPAERPHARGDEAALLARTASIPDLPAP